LSTKCGKEVSSELIKDGRFRYNASSKQIDTNNEALSSMRSGDIHLSKELVASCSDGAGEYQGPEETDE
jgi:hypothetical protein